MLSIYPYAHLLGRCWGPRHPVICAGTDFLFDPEPEFQLQPNPCHRAFVPNPSVCRLRLVSIYPYVWSSVDAGIEAIIPSIPTLFFRSPWNQHGSFLPILGTVR
jgi:hypothetical protein